MTPHLSALDRRFLQLHADSCRLLEITSNDVLYQKPREIPQTFAMFSVGEYILRSAAAVEQTFGGITTRLWDDPFEWTLPEKLRSTELILEYLQEVESTRSRGFAFLKEDADLLKHLPAPEKLTSVFELLLTTVARASHFQGRAFAVFQMLSNEKLPRI